MIRSLQHQDGDDFFSFLDKKEKGKPENDSGDFDFSKRRKQKTIGLIGGLSYLSTVDYYKGLNEEVAKELGAGHQAKIIMQSLDMF